MGGAATATATADGDDRDAGGALPPSLVASYAGCLLRSAFQPIYSLSHRRLVGHEALLRATDAAGRALSPPDLFARCAGAEQRRQLDRACARLHAASFAAQAEGPQWLFLNVDASMLAAGGDRHRDWPLPADGSSRLAPSQVVVELLENELPAGAQAERWAADLRERGYLVALDDFGAGHSNFDRVFRLHPYVVKLDRSVTAQAATDRRVRRVMAQMISLLHECGTLVLVEGVETADEAHIALDADADLVQGYRFGRPDPTLRRSGEANAAMHDVWASSSERAHADMQAWRRHVEPYIEALLEARDRLCAGEPMAAASARFLGLASADLCFQLDADGVQVGANAMKARDGAAPPGAANPFAPLADVGGARWSRRPYFRRAVANPGQVQLTRPYPTMHTRRMSVTLSVCFELAGETRVVCGDMLWHTDTDRPAFGSTVFDTTL